MLSIGIASTGVLTFAYFAIASHVLDAPQRARVRHLDVLWSVMFVIICVIYRPIEQLLSRTIADRRARGIDRHPMRVPITIQGGFALLFLRGRAAAARRRSRTASSHSTTLYWVLRRRHPRLRRELLRARLARRPQVLRALRRAGLHGVGLAARLRARGRGRHHPRPVRDRARHRGRARSCRSSSCPRRSRRRAAARPARAPRDHRRRARGARGRGHRGGRAATSRSAAARASRSPSRASSSPSRRC